MTGTNKRVNLLQPSISLGDFYLTDAGGSPTQVTKGFALSSPSVKLTTGLQPTNQSNAELMGFGIHYATAPTGSVAMWLGDISGGSANAQVMMDSYDPAPSTAYMNIWASSPGITVATPHAGWHYMRRHSSTTVKYRINTNTYTDATSTSSVNDFGLYEMMIGNSGGHTVGCAMQTQGVDDADDAAIYTAIQTFITATGK